MSNETASEESFFDNIKSTLIQRFSTPLYLYVITAFCVENWDKILYVAFGEGTIDTRMSIVQMEGIHFWEPILCGIGMTIAMPFLSRGIEWCHLLSDRFHCYLSSKRDTERVASINGLKLLERQYEIDRAIKEVRHNTAIELIEHRKELRLKNLKNKEQILLNNIKNLTRDNDERYNTRLNLDNDFNRLYKFLKVIKNAFSSIDSVNNLDCTDNNLDPFELKKEIITIKSLYLKDIEKYLKDINLLEERLNPQIQRSVQENKNILWKNAQN